MLPANRHAPTAAPDATPSQRRSWLVFADGGPAADLPGSVVADVTLAHGGSAFREALRTRRPSVVVCSYPPATATDIAAVARERLLRPSLRAVLITPPEAADLRLEALALGFDDAVASSIDPAELAGRLAWLAERVGDIDGVGAVLAFGDDFELDTMAHELRHRGRTVHLRPKEFGLLALLAAHPGRAYTRAELLDRVWGRRQSGGRTVDVHVRWLRSKIEPDPERPSTLVTVRGVGYRLDLARH